MNNSLLFAFFIRSFVASILYTKNNNNVKKWVACCIFSTSKLIIRGETEREK